MDLVASREWRVLGDQSNLVSDRLWPISDRFSARNPPLSATNPGPSASGKSRPTPANNERPLWVIGQCVAGFLWTFRFIAASRELGVQIPQERLDAPFGLWEDGHAALAQFLQRAGEN
jgi:hypothetical protein